MGISPERHKEIMSATQIKNFKLRMRKLHARPGQTGLCSPLPYHGSVVKAAARNSRKQGG